ncbi:3481_t:CDS:2 [Ambispora gerdemannii]|uniref:NADH-cytochrome b5 reductase n=1 Tax=Ambispora gerdemannii TaxID=144530 RepID=A0A9N8YVG2_9GLOM|nr:3481_t:CDS:2 [Ambispora gerdemannii]
MTDIFTAKTAVELGLSAGILIGFKTYMPEPFPFVVIIIVVAWFKYLYIDRETPKQPVLNPNEWKKFPLIEKHKVSPNVALYRFALPNQDDTLGLPVGQHISVQADIGGKLVQRSYTPTSSDDNLGFFDLLIKTYPNGLVSKYVDLLEINQTLTVKGPKGQFIYKAGLVRAFGMIAGGTGITPMIQIIREILKHPEDKTLVNLIFANVNFDDILLKDELDQLAEHNENFKVYYVLNNPPEGWTGGCGFVSAEMIKEHCPPPASDIKILLCGPSPMITAMTKITDSLGYEKPRGISKLEDQVFKF